MSIVCMLSLAAFVGTIVSMMWGKFPLSVPVLLLSIALLLSCFSLR